MRAGRAVVVLDTALMSIAAHFRCAFHMSMSTDRGSGRYLRAQRELSLRRREYCPSVAPYQAEQKWAAWDEPRERFHCQWAVGRLGYPALSGHLTKMGYRSRVEESIGPLFEIGLRRNAVGDVSSEPGTLRSPPNHSQSHPVAVMPIRSLRVMKFKFK